MGVMASQITSLTTVYSTVYLGAYQRKHQSSASLAFVLGIHRSPVNSPHKWPVTRKMFPFDDVIMTFISMDGGFPMIPYIQFTIEWQGTPWSLDRIDLLCLSSLYRARSVEDLVESVWVYPAKMKYVPSLIFGWYMGPHLHTIQCSMYETNQHTINTLITYFSTMWSWLVYWQK